MWSRTCSIKTGKLVGLHVPDFGGFVCSNRLVLTMCFQCYYVCMYFQHILSQYSISVSDENISNFSRGKEKELWLEVGNIFSKIMKVSDFYYVLNHNEIKAVMLL